MSRKNTWLRISLWGIALYWILYWLGLDWARTLVKPIPVLAMALALFDLPPDTFTRRLRTGLLLCAAGDLAIEVNFLLGLSVFLIGHLWYIGAFLQESVEGKLMRAIPPTLFSWWVYKTIQPNLEQLSLAVGLYSAVICTMLWRAGALVSWRRPWAQTLLLGAICFAISDAAIAFDRFYHPISGARYWIMILYWLGQWKLTQAALQRDR
jgi:alkenylglycerophosphocholine hydrolase